MLITIKRIRKSPETIDGQLYIDGMRICDTAENAKSAIKAGTYPVIIHKCHQHARKMPVILVKGECSQGGAADAKGVFSEGSLPFPKDSFQKSPSPKCDCCKKLDFVSNNTSLPLYCSMLKPGNGVYKREDGSILVGDYLALGCLKHPRKAFDNIYDRIRKNVERGNEVTLIIEEGYPKPKELSPFEMGTQILAQMGGRKSNIKTVNT